jgi:hypothetical protein
MAMELQKRWRAAIYCWQIAMSAGIPYTMLRDTILTHPTLVEGLIPLFSSPASTQEPADEENRAGLKQKTVSW